MPRPGGWVPPKGWPVSTRRSGRTRWSMGSSRAWAACWALLLMAMPPGVETVRATPPSQEPDDLCPILRSVAPPEFGQYETVTGERGCIALYDCGANQCALRLFLDRVDSDAQAREYFSHDQRFWGALASAVPLGEDALQYRDQYGEYLVLLIRGPYILQVKTAATGKREKTIEDERWELRARQVAQHVDLQLQALSRRQLTDPPARPVQQPAQQAAGGALKEASLDAYVRADPAAFWARISGGISQQGGKTYSDNVERGAAALLEALGSPQQRTELQRRAATLVGEAHALAQADDQVGPVFPALTAGMPILVRLGLRSGLRQETGTLSAVQRFSALLAAMDLRARGVGPPP